MEKKVFDVSAITAGFLTALEHFANAENAYFDALVGFVGADSANEIYNKTADVFKQTRKVITDGLGDCIWCNMQYTDNRNAI